MVASEQVCLKWNSHFSSLLDEFTRLLNENLFTDITIKCCNGSLNAHKFILSTCSHFLHELLIESEMYSGARSNTCIFLPDFQIQCMRDLLTYIYKGEISIQGDKIEELVNLASLLQIRGIAVKESTPIVFTANYCSTILDSSESAEEAQPELSGDSVRPSTVAATDTQTFSDQQHTRSSADSTPPALWRDFCAQPLEPHLSCSSLWASLGVSQQKQPSQPTATFWEHLGALDTLSQGANNHQNDTCDTSSSSINDRSESATGHRTCLLCGKQFSGPESGHQLRRHIMKMHPIGRHERELKCELCGLSFTGENGSKQLQLHILRVHSRTRLERQFKCEHCGAAFYYSAHLKRHIRTHTGEKPFQCMYCSHAFSRQDRLKSHINKDHLNLDVKHIKCAPQVPKTVTKVAKSVSSTVSEDQPEVSSKKCQICGQQFSGPNCSKQLKLHTLSVHQCGKLERQFTCEYCGATFSRAAHMKRHVRTHTGEKPFQCSQCELAFSRQDKLKAHTKKYHFTGPPKVIQIYTD